MAKTKIKTSEKVVPMIYAYTTPTVTTNQGWTKIGYTEQEVEERVKQQTHTANVEYKIEWRGNATFDDGSNESFKDHDLHRYLVSQGVERRPRTEWFHINPKPEAREMFMDFRENRGVSKDESTVMPYTLRDEQEEAVSKADEYFKNHENGEFLWNCKPRFGKTLAVYELAKRMNAEKVLVVTNRPAVANSWYADYCKFARGEHFEYFATRNEAIKGAYVVNTDSALIQPKGCVYIEFESLQDLKGSKYLGTGVYDKFKKVANITWDLLVIDEAHEGIDTYKTDVLFDKIKRKNTLHLSGTPFKALANAKFGSDAIYNWTYVDEQKAKQEWYKQNDDETERNPHEDLPELCMFTYKMSDMIRDKIKQGIDVDGDGNNEEYAFDLNEFFSTDKEGHFFIHEASVNRFLDTLTTNEKYPFSTPELRNELKHTLWFLDRVDSAKELAKKLKKHPVFSEYEIIIAAGDGKLDDETNMKKSYEKVVNAIANNDKTITLTVGQLTTGVTIPEWTAVLMLCNVQSESLYMQAAFRAQNPCLFQDGTEFKRKERAYVFDFDPTRSLDTFEKFANNLYTGTVNGGGSVEQREKNIRELLNFFPVIGEDEEGKMVELDAETVLIMPRKIRSTEVVNHGFMSNFLFQNISSIFQAPEIVSGILQKCAPVKDGKNKNDIHVSEKDTEQLNINDEGEVEIPKEKIEEKKESIFGNKIYGIKEIAEKVSDIVAEETDNKEEDTDETVDTNVKKVNAVAEAVKEGSDRLIAQVIADAKESYGKQLSPNQQKRLAVVAKDSVEKIIDKAKTEVVAKINVIDSDADELVNAAKTDEEARELRKDAQEQKQKEVETFANDYMKGILNDIQNEVQTIVTTDVETKKKQEEKKDIEENVRDHLRGFSRTIPSFLMAYGDRETTLATFDKIIPNNVFVDVTSITLDEFRFLRDGGDYQDEDGNTKHYNGHLFDEMVFNDSIQEFLNLKNKLSDYFNEENETDIFDYIPPQKTNQIFTPKNVVKEMVDLLEEENPGCFDDDTKTFADLYMKSGLYITEIVKRLYNSEVMKQKYPDNAERLRHIFSKQVYGCAPTEILYRITKNYILGFAEEGEELENHIELCDTLEYAKDGTLGEKLEELFPELEG